MARKNQQALLRYDCDDDQCQLRREDFESQQSESSGLINQAGGSMKTMAYGASDMAGGAAKGAVGLAQGAANLAQGAATAVRNTLRSSPESHNLHTRVPTAQPQNPRY